MQGMEKYRNLGETCGYNVQWFFRGIGDHRTHYKRYEYIAAALNRKNNVAILLPLPFHFGRSKGNEIQNTINPLDRLKIHGSFLYHGGYTQVQADVEALYNDIKMDPARFNLLEDSDVSILGYSIGGVSAVAAANHLQKTLNISLNSLILMLSAWKIQDIEPSAIGDFFRILDPNLTQAWVNLLRELVSIKDDESVDGVFKELIWGVDTDKDTKIEFDKMAQKVLFIDGQFDEIFNPTIIRDRRDSLQKVNLKNCTFLSVPVDHAAIRGSFSFLPEYIGLFCQL
jgi:hypothetical protein